MVRYKDIVVVVACALFLMPVKAQNKWTTHFAYNNVTQIAVAPDKVYALSDGSLFSVEKQSEQMRVYDRQSGLHGNGITCIHYDSIGGQLIIGYGNGMIDLLSARGVRYLGELYDKDMTQLKTIHNVTIHGRTAYLSTAYGVQTMDLRERKLVDSYWLRPGGQETDVLDVLLANDSIYAFTQDSLFAASMHANIVDYTVWKREIRSARIQPDSEKGKHYGDATDQWYAGSAEGIVRVTATNRLTYKPEGPLTNTPYRMTVQNGLLFVVPGGRWGSQYHQAGCVMRYDGNRWTNIPTQAITAVTNRPAMDFMNVAVDPQDRNHYYVTSYGTGLYEFQGETLVRADIAGGDNTLVSAEPIAPSYYTRLDCAVFDDAGNIWMLDAEAFDQLQCKAADGTWHALTIIANGQNLGFNTPGGLVLDRIHPHHKWMCTARYNTFLCLMDDQGTPFETSDDRTMVRSEWQTQTGVSFQPMEIYELMQDQSGRLWMATDIGIAYIDPNTDFFTSDAIVQPSLTDNNGEDPIAAQRINAICQSPDGHIWVGSANLGVYELNEEATEIIAYYTTGNSAMPDNGILSLAAGEDGHIWIGTSEGLVEYNPQGTDEGLKKTRDEDDELEAGSMLQWKLHFSYNNPEEVAATPSRIYALAGGALYYVDRADEHIEYMSKATGLTGSMIVHIAYDSRSGQLIVAYEEGRIDLIDEEGDVRQMPDLYMKASSVPVTANGIAVGSRYAYLGMPFGILAIDPGKAEVKETYYIGEESSSVEVLHIVELGDSLFAFADGSLYSAALRDNLVDYSYWHKRALPEGEVMQAVAFNNALHMLLDKHLYMQQNGQWIRQIDQKELEWIHWTGGQLLTYINGQGFYRISEDYQLSGLTANYVAVDGVWTEGEYWLAEKEKGLVKLSSAGDTRFIPEGPQNNKTYSLFTAHDRIYIAPGGRWASQYSLQSSLSIYDGTQWKGIPWREIYTKTRHDIRDAVSYAVDPNDPDHFFVATYGTGVYEFQGNYIYQYDSLSPGCTLRRASMDVRDAYFTRTDGALWDDQGNLWVMNATSIGKPLHVRTPAGQWYGLNLRYGGSNMSFTTPTGIWVDKRNSHRKWMMDQRFEPKLVLLDDNGTPTESYDDRCVARNSFVDQNGNTLTPATIRSFAQDKKNRIWIGTQSGILLIEEKTDFFTSNKCHRIIIPRNDGTGLGDYLLGDEQINCLAVDGGNRMWIGTANSGLYLIEDDTVTVAHFTENNSLLPSDNILSIAILPKTGEVFVATDKGLASYRSDASEPAERFGDAYAFPNPVRPDYGGVISICGLKENTVVNIIDAAGNLVCKTRSNGGTAVWDGKLPDGRRATPGIYTALCNAKKGHTVVKIAVIR